MRAVDVERAAPLDATAVLRRELEPRYRHVDRRAAGRAPRDLRVYQHERTREPERRVARRTGGRGRRRCRRIRRRSELPVGASVGQRLEHEIEAVELDALGDDLPVAQKRPGRDRTLHAHRTRKLGP